MACAASPAPPLAKATAPAVAAATGPVSWDVSVAADWTITQRVCWSGARAWLMPEARSGLAYARVVDDTGRALSVGRRGASLASSAKDAACAVVTVDAARAASELDDDDALMLSGGALVGTPDVWLWRPEPWPVDATGTLTLQLAEGMAASVPWDVDEAGRYVVTASTWKLMAKAAFGALRTRTIEAGAARFTLTQLPGALRATDAGLERWLTDAVDAVSLVGGRFPQRHAQVLLAPVRGGRAIPFGMAMRGGGPTALILVSDRASDADLRGEWVGVHELSHLLLPPVVRTDAWLSEGLASYYQQTLRGRAALLSPEEAWGELVAGLDRGRDGARGRPLADASARMHQDHRYQHVYWGGAAIMLLLDVQLRQHGSSLDALVADVRAREPRDVRDRSAAEVVDWWAASAKTVPAVDVRGVVARALAVPFVDVEPVLAALGVRRAPRRASGVLLVDDAPLAAVRRAIAGG